MKIAIVFGGYSPEWVISEKSAKVVEHHLRNEGLDCTLVRIAEDAWTASVNGAGDLPVDRNDFSVNVKGVHLRFDVVFNAIHGTPGEDGRLQGYFDMLGIPYTSPGVLASALTFNKALCNGYLRQYSDVNIASSVVLHHGDAVKTDSILATVGLPCFVKPSCAGSSFGISKVKKAEELLPAIAFAFTHDSEVIIEQFVKGTEVSVGVYRQNGNTVALAGTEIETTNEFFDYQAKYEGASREITPPRVSDTVSDALRQTTVRVFDRLGLKGMSRIDFIVNEEGQPFLIEVNTVPGLSEESILPQQVVHAGMTLGSFFKMLIEEAVTAR
jgi:D-alanine-D-alanine ligase